MIRMASIAGSRRRFMGPPTAPLRTEPAQLDQGIFGRWDGYFILATAVGITLTCQPGTFSNAAGATAVTGQWWDYGNDVPLGPANTTSLLITENLIGTWVGYRETASRAGFTTVYEQWGSSAQVFPASVTMPQFWQVPTPIRPLVIAGEVVNKPVYTWTDPASLGTTIEGQWYKNGAATGVSDATYSDTVEGDTLVWAERAIANQTLATSVWEPAWILNEPANFASYGALVSAKLTNARASVIDGVASRIEGLPGGGANMDVYTSYDHVNRQYVRNPDLWANDLLWELSAFFTRRYYGPPNYTSVANTAYGVMLVGPRIALGCGHAYTPVGDYLYWTTSDNRTVKARVIGVSPGWHSTSMPNRTHLDSKHYNDTAIYVLDRDVAVQGVAIMPILAVTSVEARRLRMTMDGAGLPVIGFSRAWRSKDEPVYADYDFQHDQLLWIKDTDNPNRNYTGPYAAYNYNVQSGDSGHPTILLINDEPYQIGALTYAQLGDWASGTYNITPLVQGVWDSYESIAHDLLLEEAMTAAINAGLLDAPLDTKLHFSYQWTPTLLQLDDDTILTLDDDTPLTLLPT